MFTENVSIHTLHELEASSDQYRADWLTRISVSIHTLHELEARDEWAQAILDCLNNVSIHTLHELEARGNIPPPTGGHLWFPFIRFTNWKQVGRFLRRRRWLDCRVSIHTLHELEAR